MKDARSLLAPTLVLAGAACAAAGAATPPALAAIVEAERAFARASVAKGMRAAFLESFAEDGIALQPHPVRIREAYARDETAPPPSILLEWEPASGDVAQSGELGWLTGPYVASDRTRRDRPPRHGFYVSVWRKQAGAPWRVVLDLGTTTPAPRGRALGHPFRRAPGGANPSVQREDLSAAEAAFLAEAREGGLAGAYAARLAPGARVHRSGTFPLTDPAAIRAHLEAAGQTLEAGEVRGSTVASSGELGYAWGTYELAGGEPERGYFARVWQRDGEGRWRIVLDAAVPVPPDQW
jgi:ketosteroid isomerase-like protein